LGFVVGICLLFLLYVRVSLLVYAFISFFFVIRSFTVFHSIPFDLN